MQEADPSAGGARSSLPFTSSPEEVFAVASDAWRFADWVVGAANVRAVDDGWPEPGSQFHHEVGIGPLRLRDATQLLALEAPRRVVLKVKVRPGGMGRVTLTIEPREGGGSEVLIEEVPTEGLVRVLDSWLLRRVTMLRNLESLKRLRRLVDGS